MTGPYKDMEQIIAERVIQELAENDIPDTTENRLIAYQGLRDCWTEEDGDNPDAQAWIMTLSIMILRLTLVRFREIVGIVE